MFLCLRCSRVRYPEEEKRPEARPDGSQRGKEAVRQNSFVRSAVSICVSTALLVAASSVTSVADQGPVQWKMQGTIPGHLPVIGSAGKFVSEQISKVSGGAFEIRWYEPNALVPALEAFDAVRLGSVDAAFGVSGYWAGKIRSAALFSTHPFGPGPVEYLAWLEHGGGQVLWDRIYEPHGVKGIACVSIGPEASGWFRREIKSVEDLRGLKVRFAGFAGKVLQKLGASTQLLAAGEVLPALERGTIDAAEFSMPAIDLGLGLHHVAKHYYLPGWHQPGTVGELLVNLENWRALSVTQRSQVELVCQAAARRSLVESVSIQGEALQAIESEGVTVHRWPVGLIEAFRAAWNEVVAEEVAADADFRRVWESITAFRERYARWREVGYLD